MLATIFLSLSAVFLPLVSFSFPVAGVVIACIGLIIIFFAPEIGVVFMVAGGLIYFIGPLLIGIAAIALIGYIALNASG